MRRRRKLFFSRFGDTAQNQFYLNTNVRRNQLMLAISSLGYRSLGNGRNVEAALNAMRTQQFIQSRVRLQPQTWSLMYRHADVALL